MSNVTRQTVPTRSAGVLAQQVKPDDPALVLLNPRSGGYFTLEDVGKRVWELCDGKRTIADIATTISEEYEAPADVIESDVIALVKELLDEELVGSAG